MSKLERIATDLKEAAEQFRDCRPKITVCRDQGNDIVNGPEVVWYTTSESAFLRLESIANSIVREMRLNIAPPNGWRKLPEVWEQGPRFNNSGRLLHWLAQKDRKEPEEFRMFRIGGTGSEQGNKFFEVFPLDNVFLLILEFVRDSIDGMSGPSNPTEAALGREFRNNGESQGELLTAKFIEDRYGISGSSLTRTGVGNRKKEGKAFIYEWKFVKSLSDAKFATEDKNKKS